LSDTVRAKTLQENETFAKVPGLQNPWNKGHAKNAGFTVTVKFSAPQ